VSEGDYVQTGQMLFEIADLSQLWLDLDAYESDIGWIRLGQDVRFDVESYPGRSFEGTVAFIEPFLDESTRTVNVRVNVDNSEGLLKPGMLARGTVHPRIGPGGQVYAEDLAGKFISPMHPWIVKDAPGNCDICGMALVPAEELGYATSPQAGEPPMLVPAGAVLRTGKRAVVYVEKENAGQAAYEGREITLGPRTNDGFIVFDGLREGERVVSNGAFKIDSALQIEAKPSMMNPAPVLVGADDEAAGHAHGGHGQSTPQTPPADDAGMVPVEQAVAALGPYLALQEALAADNLEGAQEALRDMMAATGHSGPLPGIIHAMLAAADIDALRKPLFDKLSASMIEVVKAHPDRFPTLLQMHCPMVYRDRGADWLQRERPLRNPYFGAMMLSCGEVTATLGQQSQPD
jgi:Cu(I)/Ag(I) efflux system membrane fusion protein